MWSISEYSSSAVRSSNTFGATWMRQEIANSRMNPFKQIQNKETRLFRRVWTAAIVTFWAQTLAWNWQGKPECSKTRSFCLALRHLAPLPATCEPQGPASLRLSCQGPPMGLRVESARSELRVLVVEGQEHSYLEPEREAPSLSHSNYDRHIPKLPQSIIGNNKPITTNYRPSNNRS